MAPSPLSVGEAGGWGWDVLWNRVQYRPPSLGWVPQSRAQHRWGWGCRGALPRAHPALYQWSTSCHLDRAEGCPDGR